MLAAAPIGGHVVDDEYFELIRREQAARSLDTSIFCAVQLPTVVLAGSAATRRCNAYLGRHGNNQLRSFGASIYEADRTFVAESLITPLTNMTGFDFVGISFGVFIDTAAAVTDTARFRVRLAAISETQLWGAP